jgi:hypothetical protein
MVEKATMPQFAIVSGVSAKITGPQAEMLAATYGVGPALTMEYVVQWTKDKLKRTVDPTKPGQYFSALQQYAGENGYPLLVLDRYPVLDEEAKTFQKYFEGRTLVVASFDADLETDTAVYTEEFPDEEIEDEAREQKLKEARTNQEKMIEEFKAKSAPTVMSLSVADITGDAPRLTVDGINVQICNRLKPKVYVLVAPSGKVDLGSLIANAVCTARREGKKGTKFTVIDSDALFTLGGHSSELEDKLSKASYTADAPDTVPASLWKELFTEALQKSANPMGTFFVTNFPTPSSVTSTPTIRDQFSMLESITQFMGIMHVKLSDAAYQRCAAGKPVGPDDIASYENFYEKVKNGTIVQFGAEKIRECVIDNCSSAEDAAKTAAADFLAFQEKAEQARR